jgi:hypothetical protein
MRWQGTKVVSRRLLRPVRKYGNHCFAMAKTGFCTTEYTYILPDELVADALSQGAEEAEVGANT